MSDLIFEEPGHTTPFEQAIKRESLGVEMSQHCSFCQQPMTGSIHQCPPEFYHVGAMSSGSSDGLKPLRECTTHHHACDCREAAFSEMKRDLGAELKENAELRIRLARYEHETETVKELKSQVEIAKGALKFYGDNLNYEMAFRNDLNCYVPANSEGTTAIEVDHGTTAREALEKMGQG